MSLVNRGIIFPLVALALGAASLGCASSSAMDEDDLAAAAATVASSRAELVSAIDLNADQQVKLAQLHDAGHATPDRPTIEQIVVWFTVHLDLTREQAAKLRAYLEAHIQGAAPTHP